MSKLSFPKDFVNQVLNGDCLELMKQIPNNSVDLVVTSPPYNLKRSTGGGLDANCGKWPNAALKKGYENHDDFMPHDEYVKWQRKCLTEMLRIIPENGAIFYNHKWRVQKGLIQDRQDIMEGFPVRQIIIWQRKGGINFNAGYFLPTYEVIYMITKPKFKLALRGNRFGDVWSITQEMKNPHPAPFPKELTDRIISSTEAELIIDPFMGSGTTALSARSLGRSFIGIEKSKKYCDWANMRLDGKSLLGLE